MTDDLPSKEPEVTPGLVPDPKPPQAPTAEPPPPAAPPVEAPPATEPAATEPAATEPEATQGVPPDTGAEPRPRRLDTRMIAAGVGLGAIAVVLILLLLMLFAPSIAPIKLGSAATAARASVEDDVDRISRRFAESLYTFNYETIDDDLDRIQRDATGNFSRELETVLGDVDVFRDAIVEARGQSSGDVQGVDVQEVRDDTATSRVWVIQSIRNRRNPEQRQQLSTVELTLVKTSGGWKVDGVRQFRATAAPAATGQ